MTVDTSTVLTDGQRERILGLAAAEQADSGCRPLGEHARAALSSERGQTPGIDRHWLWHDPDLQAYACEITHSPGVAGPLFELTAEPLVPGAAHLLLTGITQQVEHGAIWTHGDRAQARLAAAMLGLRLDRELLLLGRSLPADMGPAPAPGVLVRPFDPARDMGPWLAVNGLAFTELPDQGALTEADLRTKLSADWYDPLGLLVAERDDGLVGFHWTKVDPDATFGGRVSGEVYVLAVDPAWRGTGLAQALLDAGLSHLADRGLADVHLYVDAANTRAIGFYQRAGFAYRDTDRQYSW